MIASTLFSRAAVLLGAVKTVSSLGTAIIHNQCDFDVYLWSVSQTSGSMQTLKANGGEYSESYQINPDGGGIAIKVGVDTYGYNVTQYEYTLSGDSLWYDLSLINGYPFVEYGVTVVPSDASCNPVTCPAGVAACAAAYMVPTDNFATAECGASSDTVVLLCAGESSSGSPAVSSIATSAIATASVASTSTTKKQQHSQTYVAPVTATAWVQTTVTTGSAPVTTAAAIHVAPGVIVHTTFVTEIVTVNARDAAAAPTPVAVAEPVQKRSDRRIHRHEHGQQRRHEHAHAHHQEDDA